MANPGRGRGCLPIPPHGRKKDALTVTVPVVPRSTSGRLVYRTVPTIEGAVIGREKASAASDLTRRGRPADAHVEDNRVARDMGLGRRRGGSAIMLPFRSGSSAKNPRRRQRATASQRAEVMLRPRIERNQHHHPSKAVSWTDVLAGGALVALAHNAHPILHQSGSRSRRMATPMWRRVTAARGPVPKRLFNAQQNAYRCHPPGGDPGCGAARQSRRRIRLRVGQP